MRRNFQYIIGDFDLNKPLSEYSLVSARNMMSDIALRVELPEGVQLNKYPTDSWSTTDCNIPLKELNPKAMLYYSNHWAEIEGLLEQDVSAHDWWRVLQSDQYLMKQTPYGWIACDGAICNSKRIRRIDYVAKALENEMSFNDIIHTNKLSPYIKSALLENKLIALNSDFDLKWIGKNFSSVSKDDAQKYNSLVADNIAYIDKSNSINSKIVIKKGTTCQLHCRVHPHYNTRKPIMEIDLYIGKYYNERYDLMFTRIFENVDFEKINATFS